MKLPRPELWAELSPLLHELLDLSASAQQVRLAALRQQNPGLAEELAALLSEARAAHSNGFLANARAHAHAHAGYRR